MKLKVNSIIKIALLLILLPSMGRAFGENLTIGVGETLTLKVPSVPRGYVDKAVWACGNHAISFASKSTTQAEIKALKAFDGFAKVELVYVEKYVDGKGFTRANTYTKDFYVACSTSAAGGGGSTAATSIIVENQVRVAMGERTQLRYRLVPEGSKADVKIYSYSNQYASYTLNEAEKCVEVLGRSAGETEVQVYFYNEKREEIGAYCSVTVYDPTWTEPESVELPDAMLFTVGEAKKLLPIVTPSNATALYKWSCGGYDIVSMSNGRVKAKAPGISDITLKTSNGLMSRCTAVVVDEAVQIPGLGSALNRAASILKQSESDNVK